MSDKEINSYTAGRELQKENNKPYQPQESESVDAFISKSLENVKNIKVATSQFNILKDFDTTVESPLARTSTPWGQSMFDEDYTYDLEDVQDVRANNQPWFAQLAAGIVKGASLAGTTFLNSNLGLLTGVVEAAATQDSSKIFNGTIAQGLEAWNQKMEEWLPNYRTRQEETGPWWENLDTMNFWADGLIKNMGFTVGAMYSGMAFNKLLQGMKILNNGIGAALTGSIYSAFNEGRIEALHTANDKIQYDTALYQDYCYNQMKDYGIDPNNPESMQRALDNGEIINTGTDEKPFWVLNNRESLESFDRTMQDINDRANNAGMATLAANTALLAADNLFQFGKIFARGFRNAKNIAEATRGADGLIKSVKDTSTLAKVGRGLANSLAEGNEEMAQGLISATSGLYYGIDEDSPDSYFKAISDNKSIKDSNDFITALTEGFANTYGNGEEWQEFMIGAVTGALGMPTFGKVNNSNNDVWVGKNKIVGMSGGILGEVFGINAEEKKRKEDIDWINNYEKGLKEHKRHFAASNSFSRLMDGYALEGNAFEYKNAEDNSDFVAIDKYARLGILDEFKKLVNTDFENMSDEDLEFIAITTTPTNLQDDLSTSKESGWKNVDGSLMSSTEEGKLKMKEELKSKKEKILEEIEEYEKIVSEVRARAQNALSDDDVTELSWLNWKVNRFNKRFKNINKEVNPLLSRLSDVIKDITDEFEREKHLTGTEEQSLKNWNMWSNIISSLQKSPDALGFASKLNNIQSLIDLIDHKDMRKLLLKKGMSSSQLDDLLPKMRDSLKLASVAEAFNKRYEEFKDDPLKIKSNHIKLQEEFISKEVKEIQEKFSKAKNISELKKLYEESSNPNIASIALKNLVQQNNKIAKDFIDNDNYKNEAISNIDGKSIEDIIKNIYNNTGKEYGKLNEESRADAKIILNHHFNKNINKGLNILGSVNSIFMSLEDFNNTINPEGNILEEEVDIRHQIALYLAKHSLVLTNKSKDFKDKFSPAYKDSRLISDVKFTKQTGSTTTGSSETSVIPSTNPPKQGKVPSENTPGEFSDKEALDHDKRMNSGSESTTLEESRFYISAIPELDDLKKDGKFIPFKETHNNYADIYDYLVSQGTFDYVNKGHLKKGDTVYFYIDSKYEVKEDEEIPIFMAVKNTDGSYQCIGVLKSPKEKENLSVGLKELCEDIIKKYKDRTNKNVSFIYEKTSKVHQLFSGVVPYKEGKPQSISELVKAEGEKVLDEIAIGIYNQLVWTTSVGNNINVNNFKNNISQSGKPYLLIPDGTGSYKPMSLRIAHFNKEYLDSEKDKNNPFIKKFKEDLKTVLEKLETIQDNKDKGFEIKKVVKRYVYISGKETELFFDINNSGSLSIKEKKIGEKESIEQSNDININKDNVDTTINTILKELTKFDRPIQVDKTELNEEKKDLVKFFIDSNVIKSNVTSLRVKSTYFSIDYYNPETGKFEDAEDLKFPSENPPSNSSGKEPNPVGGLENGNWSFIDGKGDTIVIGPNGNIVSINGNKIQSGTTSEKIEESTESVKIYKAFINKEEGLETVEYEGTTYIILGNGKIFNTNTILFENDLRLKAKIFQTYKNNEVLEVIKNYNTFSEEHIKFNEDTHTYTFDGKEIDKSVTGLLETGDFPRHLGFTGEIGTAVDELTRKYFLNGVNSINSANLSPILKGRSKNIIDDLSRLYNYFRKIHGNNCLVISDLKPLAGTIDKDENKISVAGTIDLLVIDEQGKVHLYDMKVKNNLNLNKKDKERYTHQLNSYRQLIKLNLGLDVESMNLIWFNTKYKTLGISDYSIDKNNGNINVTRNGKSETLEWLTPNLKLEVKNSIKPIKDDKDVLNNLENIPIENISSSNTTETPIEDNQGSDSTTISESMDITLPEFIDEVISMNVGDMIHRKLKSKVLSIKSPKVNFIVAQLYSYDKSKSETSEAFAIKLKGDRFLAFKLRPTNNNQRKKGYFIDYYIVDYNGNSEEIEINSQENISFLLNKNLDIDELDINALESYLSKAVEKLEETGKYKNIELTTKADFIKIFERFKQSKSSTTQDTSNDIIQEQESEIFNKSKNAEVKGKKPKFREIDSTLPNTEVFDKEKEMSWLNKVLPQLSEQDRVRFAKGLIPIAERGSKAWGQFDGSIITISDLAASGTIYHEAFHVVFNCLLNPSERKSLLEEYRTKHPNNSEIELEEYLAEDFREYVMLGGRDIRSLGRKILDFFKSLFIKIKYWDTFRPSSLYYFNAINKGKYSKSNLERLYTPIKSEFKGKLIFAQSGTGKTTIADNINVIDSDFILGSILGVHASQAFDAFKSLSNKEKHKISKQYEQAIDSAVKKGKTVITARINSLDKADVIIYNESAELANQRTSSIDRSNNFTNNDYQKQSLEIIKSKLKDKESYALKKGEFLSNIILKDPSFNIQNEIIKKFNSVDELLKTYLDKFGFTVEEFNESGYTIEMLDRIIKLSNLEDITEATGELIAFMSMYNSTEKQLVAEMAIADGAVTKEQIFGENGDIRTIVYRKLNKSNYFKKIGKYISKELKYQFNYIKNNGKVDNSPIKESLLNKIRRIIKDFFNNLLSFENYYNLATYARQQAIQALALNDTFIKKSIFKPGDEQAGFVSKVDLVKALDENPYERDIIFKMTSLGFSLAGSAAMSVQGTVYRPAENPLHDIDFETKNKNKEYLDEILPTVFNNITHIRTIPSKTNINIAECETYLTMSVPFEVIRPTKGMALYAIKHAITGEIIASFVNSELKILKKGIKGKFLDFFVNKDSKYGNINLNYNGENLLISNYKNAMYAKLYVYEDRLKDIWDFNRFVPNKRTNSFINNDGSILPRESFGNYSKWNMLSESQKKNLSSQGMSEEVFNSLNEDEQNSIKFCFG